MFWRWVSGKITSSTVDQLSLQLKYKIPITLIQNI